MIGEEASLLALSKKAHSALHTLVRSLGYDAAFGRRLYYCRRLNVALEPFIQVNHNAFVHSARAFGGQPQRYRHVQADFPG